MIPLRFQVDPLPFNEPVVTRLRSCANDVGPYDAIFIDRDNDVLEYDLAGFSLRLHARSIEEIEGDVLLLVPGQRSAHRLIRAGSPHNTFLVTERCDQLCIMCSQPPKSHHSDLFPYFRTAALLAPQDIYIGISGGEPMLFKDELFSLISSTLKQRPDLRFHVLTNGQHFERQDIAFLQSIPNDRVLWGIPLYSADPALHDELVAKPGASERLMQSFSILAIAGAAIELRTVILRPNLSGLGRLGQFITTQLPFIGVWALMQLESIGFGRKNWDALFFDNSLDFTEIARALDIARARGIEVQLYNFPRCTVPAPFREFAPSTISDWKRRYLESCGGCRDREACGGFFEWYPESRGFERIIPL